MELKLVVAAAVAVAVAVAVEIVATLQACKYTYTAPE
jgi:hypothetical protein